MFVSCIMRAKSKRLGEATVGQFHNAILPSKTEVNTVQDVVDILLVDDRPENLVALEAVLDGPGYHLVKTESGEDALRYLLDREPAVILMDVQMPGLDGFQTAAIIKQDKRSKHIPIIFLTALNKDEKFVHQGYEGGAVDYIYKPFDAQVLKAKVAVFVDLHKKTRQLLRAEQVLRENERRERERRLRELEILSLKREQEMQQKYLDLVEGINHGIVWSAEVQNFNFSFVSPSAERILGYAREQWTGEKGFWFNHLHPGDREMFREAVDYVSKTGKEFGIEHRFVTADERVVWLHTGIRAARKGKDQGFELRGLSVEITKIKQAEEVLKRNKMRSDFMAEASLLLSKTLDFDEMLGRIGQLAVPRLADWFAIDTLDETGKLKNLSMAHADPNLSELARRFKPSDKMKFGVPYVMKNGHAELHARITDDMVSASAQDAENLEIIRKLSPRSAMVIPLFVRGQVLAVMTFISSQIGREFDQDDLAMALDLGRHIGAAMENATLYGEAQAAIRARDEFLSIASHELKTPLTPLRLQTQTLMRSIEAGNMAKLGPERIKKMLESADRQVGRLTTLVEELLDISRLNIGKLKLNFEEFEFTSVVQDVLERFSGQLAETNCAVSLDAPQTVMVGWDRFRMEQVVVNLLTNAVKYAPGKPIKIKIEVKGNRVFFRVKDDGIGIAKKDHQRIFQRFERAVSASNFGGLGLGLYIVAQIIEAHSGKISVESDLGHGSEFVVEIPARPEPVAVGA